VAEEEEEEEEDDDDAAHGAISEGGEVRSWSKRLAGLSDPATAVKTFKEKHSLIVANAKPDGHCGFMSVALQPAKQPRSIPTMPAQIKTLRVAVANIIEQKTHRSRVAFLLTEADGQGDDAKGTVLTTRAKEHRKVNTSVGLSHTSGLWFNHVDAQAIATFQQRTLFIVNYQTGYANKIPPLPNPVVSNLPLGEVELPENPAERIVLL